MKIYHRQCKGRFPSPSHIHSRLSDNRDMTSHYDKSVMLSCQNSKMPERY